MSQLCDNCNCTILVPATGTIKNATFFFCSPQCRAEFAQFSGRIGHVMAITADACNECDNALIYGLVRPAVQGAHVVGVESTASLL